MTLPKGFGPSSSKYYSHRSDKFKAVYGLVKDKFKRAYNISSEYDVLFVTGSGNLVNEMVISSFVGNVIVDSYDGHFTNRLKMFANMYNNNVSNCTLLSYVQFETSDMVLRHKPEIPANIVHVDCVSSFPYYSLPDADIITTVSGKQLCLPPGLGIIIYKKTILKYLKPVTESYLSLRKHIEYNNINMTPNTPSIGLLDIISNSDLMTKYEIRQRINNNYNISKGIKNVSKRSPLSITIPCSGITSKIADSLYKNKNDEYQIFLWAPSENEMAFLVQELNK